VTQYMLDTNTVSFLLRQHPNVTQRVIAHPMASLCISAVTEGELLFGLAKRPDAIKLQRAVHELLLRIPAKPWDRSAAESYGTARAQLEKTGKPLAPLEMLIAGHALSLDMVLVTNDRAFAQLDNLKIEDWT
jgi:tRNA(fMet)-specific endonuclease VapC